MTTRLDKYEALYIDPATQQRVRSLMLLDGGVLNQWLTELLCRGSATLLLTSNGSLSLTSTQPTRPKTRSE
ncbi:hypothetical protein D9M71_824380 [compost metagenome]